MKFSLLIKKKIGLIFVSFSLFFQTLPAIAQALIDTPADFTGVWVPVSDPTIVVEPLPLLPDVQQSYAEYRENRVSTDYDPGLNCLPYGMPRQMLLTAQYALETIQTNNKLTMIFEMHQESRRIYIDGREMPSGNIPSWLGHSVGEWSGETLVITTKGIRDGSIQFPTGPNTTITENMRFVYSKGGVQMLENELTVVDSTFFTKPVTRVIRYVRDDSEILGEYWCSDDVWQHNLSGREGDIPWR